MSPAELVDALEDAVLQMGLERGPMPYSGRAMFGRQCVAIPLNNRRELWELAQRLEARGVRICGPEIDALGAGSVAYWSQIDWPK